jgi:thymidylate kinase
MAIFVALEGPDGVGKTTLYNNLCINLPAKGYINPGATKFGVEVRKLIKSNLEISKYAEQVLMAADYINFIETMAVEDNKEDRVVVLDRANFISGYIYGSSSGLTHYQLRPFQRIIWEALSLHKIMIHILLITAPLSVINKRRMKRSGKKDRFEKRGNSFQTSVYTHYMNLSNKNMGRHLNLNDYGCNIPRLGDNISLWNIDGSKSEKYMTADAISAINSIRTLQRQKAFFIDQPE